MIDSNYRKYAKYLLLKNGLIMQAGPEHMHYRKEFTPFYIKRA